MQQLQKIGYIKLKKKVLCQLIWSAAMSKQTGGHSLNSVLEIRRVNCQVLITSRMKSCLIADVGDVSA